MPTALCTPNNPWPDATQAGLLAIETPFSPRTVPVEHRAPGTYMIEKATYEQGIVLIPTGSDPTAIPAVLPSFVTDASSQEVVLDPSNPQDMGHGGVVVFV
jgi:hypothetical protein